uniref:Transthyretin-like family protein n=1 Tax=Strongyloides papillosus TaxID=174720 RepID=A0A0N5BCI8_STREA
MVKCLSDRRGSVTLSIMTSENERVLASKIGDCDKRIAVNASFIDKNVVLGGVYKARFNLDFHGFYTRGIPTECINGIQERGNLLDCNIREIDPNKFTTPSGRNSPYIL